MMSEKESRFMKAIVSSGEKIKSLTEEMNKKIRIANDFLRDNFAPETWVTKKIDGPECNYTIESFGYAKMKDGTSYCKREAWQLCWSEQEGDPLPDDGPGMIYPLLSSPLEMRVKYLARLPELLEEVAKTIRDRAISLEVSLKL